jgi:hypothetical protein
MRLTLAASIRKKAHSLKKLSSVSFLFDTQCYHGNYFLISLLDVLERFEYLHDFFCQKAHSKIHNSVRDCTIAR